MKQSKKLTRSQREFLEREKIDTEDIRVLEETNRMMKVVNVITGQITVIQKEN